MVPRRLVVPSRKNKTIFVNFLKIFSIDQLPNIWILTVCNHLNFFLPFLFSNTRFVFRYFINISTRNSDYLKKHIFSFTKKKTKEMSKEIKRFIIISSFRSDDNIKNLLFFFFVFCLVFLLNSTMEGILYEYEKIFQEKWKHVILNEKMNKKLILLNMLSHIYTYTYIHTYRNTDYGHKALWCSL